MNEAAPTYNLLRLFPIPQPVRLLELVILTLFFILSLTRKMNAKVLIVNLCVISYVLLGVANLTVNGNLSLAGIQDIYIRVVPFLFFSVVVQGGEPDEKEIRYVLRFFHVVMLINIAIELFLQIPFYGDHEDHITGFFEDAHAFCNYLLVYSVVLFQDYLNYKELKSLLLSLVLLVLSIFPSNEKVIALCILIIGGMLLFHVISRAKGFFLKVAVVLTIITVTAVSAFLVIKTKGGDLWARADVAINTIGIENIGPVVAWPIALEKIGERPAYAFWGVGAGEYGWIAASRKVAEGKGSEHSRMFEFEFSDNNINNAGFLFRSNTWSSLLAEYGIVGFLLFMIALWLIFEGVWSYVAKSRLEKNLKMVFYLILIMVIFQGFFSPYSNWSSATLIFPMMYFAALFHNKAANEKEKALEDLTA
jgi:hypothetical protein